MLPLNTHTNSLNILGCLLLPQSTPKNHPRCSKSHSNTFSLHLSAAQVVSEYPIMALRSANQGPQMFWKGRFRGSLEVDSGFQGLSQGRLWALGRWPRGSQCYWKSCLGSRKGSEMAYLWLRIGGFGIPQGSDKADSVNTNLRAGKSGHFHGSVKDLFGLGWDSSGPGWDSSGSGWDLSGSGWDLYVRGENEICLDMGGICPESEICLGVRCVWTRMGFIWIGEEPQIFLIKWWFQCVRSARS